MTFLNLPISAIIDIIFTYPQQNRHVLQFGNLYILLKLKILTISALSFYVIKESKNEEYMHFNCFFYGGGGVQKYSNPTILKSDSKQIIRADRLFIALVFHSTISLISEFQTIYIHSLKYSK